MSDVTVTQGDNKPDITGRLTDTLTDAPVDLTDASQVFLRMRKADDKRFTVNAVCTITDAVAGEVSYSWGANDLSIDGDYEAYFHIIWDDTTQQSTWPRNTITVERR